MHYHDVFNVTFKKVLYKKCIDILDKVPAGSKVESTK